MSSSPSKPSLATPQDLRLSTLFKMMNADFRDSVVAHVLNSRSDLSDDVHESLDATINREVRVERYPTRPERAPMPFLKPAIIRELQKSEALVSAVLNAWFSSQVSLKQLVEEHLLSREIAIDYPDFKTRELNGYWSFDDWKVERDAIVEVHKDIEGDDVALMLCCVTGKMPIEMEARPEERNRTVEQAILDQTLSYLEGLPADSPEWDRVPDFLSSVARLSDDKAAEREAMASRKALETVLEEFRTEYSDKLEYYQLGVADWVAPSGGDGSVVSEALRLLNQLRGLIDESDSIPDRGATHAETTRLFGEREAVIHRIQGVKSRLDGILSPYDGPDNTPDMSNVGEEGPDEAAPGTEPGKGDSVAAVKSQAPEMSTDATLSDIRFLDRHLDFDPSILEYPVVLENSTEFVTITPVANHPDTTIAVIVESQDDGASRSVDPTDGAYTLENIPVGLTRILITTTAEDRATTRSYSLPVMRGPSSDATLKVLTPSVGDFEFSPDMTEYSSEVDGEVDGLSFVLETAHDDATVEVSLERPEGAAIDVLTFEDGRCTISDLPEGRSALSIVVTAGDGTSTLTYTVVLSRETSEGADHAELMWSLVAQDDLAGAYWISKSLAAQGQAPPSLPLLLKAVQGARWLSPDSEDFIEDLFTTVSEASYPFEDDALSILSLAAALQPSIVAPETNLLAWMLVPDRLPFLEGLVSSVRSFANRGYALRPEHIRGDEGQRRLDDLIGEASSDAGRWLEESGMRRHNLVRATNVLLHLCANGGMLNDLLRPAIDDRRGEAARVRSDVDALRQDSYRLEVIAEADRSVSGSSPRNEITGAARSWLNRAIGEACDLAARWCSLVERDDEAKMQAQNQWLSDQVSELRTQVESASGMVLEELSRVASDSRQSDVSASAICLARSIDGMLDYLSIERDPDPQSRPASIVSDMQTIIRNSRSVVSDNGQVGQLEAGLSRRLLWIPSVDLSQDGRPVNPQIPVNLSEINEDCWSGSIPIDEVVRSRVEASDFRFLDLLETVWVASRSDDMHGFYSADLSVAKETLAEHLSVVRDEVDQAANDGVIEYEGARWSEFAHALDDILDDDVLNFREVHDTLDRIQRSVGDERTRRREELIGDWAGLNEESSLGASDREMEFLNELAATFELASRDESLDIRVMEDCVSRMRNYRSGDLQDFDLGGGGRLRTTLEDFLTFSGVTGDGQTHFGGSGLRNLVRRSRDQA